jgi:hypothetical protein
LFNYNAISYNFANSTNPCLTYFIDTWIVVISTAILAKPSGSNSNKAGLKLYQNPTGVWMLGLLENNAERSESFAIPTSDNTL